MANSVDPDQTAPLGDTLFDQTCMYIKLFLESTTNQAILLLKTHFKIDCFEVEDSCVFLDRTAGNYSVKPPQPGRRILF